MNLTPYPDSTLRNSREWCVRASRMLIVVGIPEGPRKSTSYEACWPYAGDTSGWLELCRFCKSLMRVCEIMEGGREAFQQRCERILREPE